MPRLEGQTSLDETGPHHHGKVVLQTIAQAEAPGWKRMHITAEGDNTRIDQRYRGPVIHEVDTVRS